MPQLLAHDRYGPERYPVKHAIESISDPGENLNSVCCLNCISSIGVPPYIVTQLNGSTVTPSCEYTYAGLP